MLPEEAYDGKFAGRDKHNHAELMALPKAMLDALVTNPGKTLSPVWSDAVNAVLDTYLGKVPENFTFQGKVYSAGSFAEEMGLQPDDYLSFSSYTHHPFYRQFNLEIPDNWAGNLYWNIPLNEMMEIIDTALAQGYTVGWDGDVSEKSFLPKKGVAFLPEKDWDDRSDAERDEIGDAPESELVVCQELRQQHFDNYSSTDDHLMHIVGTVRDQNGTRYYRAKNSYGTLNSESDGFINLSSSYVRSKTVSILVHRDVVPTDLAEKLGIKMRQPVTVAHERGSPPVPGN